MRSLSLNRNHLKNDYRNCNIWHNHLFRCLTWKTKFSTKSDKIFSTIYKNPVNLTTILSNIIPDYWYENRYDFDFIDWIFRFSDWTTSLSDLKIYRIVNHCKSTDIKDWKTIFCTKTQQNDIRFISVTVVLSRMAFLKSNIFFREST